MPKRIEEATLQKVFAESPMRLLDTTLRDGSYVINFQFSAEDTRQIAASWTAPASSLSRNRTWCWYRRQRERPGRRA